MLGPLSFGCNRWYFIGIRGISYFCRCGKTYRILIYATEEVTKALGDRYVMSFRLSTLNLVELFERASDSLKNGYVMSMDFIREYFSILRLTHYSKRRPNF
jgi:hypothetical protein